MKTFISQRYYQIKDSSPVTHSIHQLNNRYWKSYPPFLPINQFTVVAHADEQIMSERARGRDWAPDQELAAGVITPVRLDSELQHHNTVPNPHPASHT